MYVMTSAMEKSFVGASAAASFATSEQRNVLGTARLAVSIFLVCLLLCLVPVRIMLVGIFLLSVLAVWNRTARKPETDKNQR